MIKHFILLSLIVGVVYSIPGRPSLKTTATITVKPIAGTSELKINFIENSWNAAIKKASAEKKLIFVDAYAVWCAPCRQLKESTFKDKAAAAFFNKNFVNLSLDMEKGEGVRLSDKWGVQEFPTLIILDYNGNVITGNVGFMNADDLIRFGQRALAKRK